MSNKGQVLVTVVFLVAVISLTIPLLVKDSQQEAKWTVKHTQTTKAFHLAEAGVDRGYWKLLEYKGLAEDLKTTPVEGYNFDKAYTDMEGGEYKIKLSSHSTDDQKIVITAIGRDTSKMETRAIEVVYSYPKFKAGLYLGRGNEETEFEEGVEFHWGPIMVRQSLELDAPTYFPRIYSTGAIEPFDQSPSGTNTDNKHWWSYYPVPKAPQLNFEKLKEQAIADGKYYPGSLGGQLISDEGKTWYIEGNLIMQEMSYIRGTVVVLGNCSVSVGIGNYSITRPPPDANQEYLHDNANPSSAAGDFYGDMGGFPADMDHPFVFGQSNCVSKANCIEKRVTIRGLLYCGWEYDSESPALIHGALMVPSGADDEWEPEVENDDYENEPGAEQMMVFFDPRELVDVSLMGDNFDRVSWKEVKLGW